jgi:hypothetical protein
MIQVEQSVVLAVLLLLALLLFGLIIFTRRLKSTLQQQADSQSSIQADLRALCNAAVQVGERVNRMENELKALHQRQQELGVRQEKMAQADPHEVSYEQAIKLARKGNSVDELMEICSLSRGEAELIAMMHRLDPKG